MERNKASKLEASASIPMADDDVFEFQLPQEIIQLIQSMIIQSSNSLEGERKAARTSLVSKSWHHAWSTRPDPVFRRYYFPSSRASDDLLFWEFAKTTLKRYEDLNLNIRRLKLVMTNDVSLAKEVIVEAIKLGVIDLSIQILDMRKEFVLPDEVLQSQTLARLYLSGSFTINREEEVTCYNLKSLRLKYVIVHGDLFKDLIPRCPMIEEFTLYDIYDPSNNGTRTNLLDPEFDKLHDYFPKLKYLSLKVECTLSRHDFWPKFACLKELKIKIYGYDDLRIRIPSLERIGITSSAFLLENEKINVEFDFPNIKKIQWDSVLPWHFELKTSTTRRDEWESIIDIIYRDYEPPTVEWYSKLTQFVRMLSLSRSRVSLSIFMDVREEDEEDEFRYFGDGLPIPPVEKLTLMSFEAVQPAYLDALFWSCRPKFVEIQNRCLFGLKKVNVEEFQQLRSLPWETFYHVSSYDDGYDVHFQLN